MTPTWRELWACLRAVWRAARLKPRYCGECGVPLTADETITCAECIELRMTRRASMLTPDVLAYQQQIMTAAAMSSMAAAQGPLNPMAAAIAQQAAFPLQAALSAQMQSGAMGNGLGQWIGGPVAGGFGHLLGLH